MAKRVYIGVNNFEPVDLPSGYTQVEYIQSSSSGGQYINTGFAPDSNTRIVCTVYGFDTSKGSQFVFGSRVSSSSNSFTLLCTDNQAYRSDFGANQATFNTSVNFSGLMTIDKNKTVTTLNSNDTVNNTAQSFTSSLNIYLLACNTNGAAGYYAENVKLYSCQIYNNGTLVRNFIPCKNSNGTVGMYDLVNSTFYTNAGTGVFSAGTSTVQSLARQIKRFYVGIDGSARKIKKGYIGVSDVARCFLSPNLEYVTEVITKTKSWVCPAGTTSVTLRLFGGGGGGHYSYSGGGGGGHMSYSAVSVTPGKTYTITIGKGGGNGGGSGGTTSFGNLLSASGGYGAGSYGGYGGSGGGGGDIQGSGNGGDAQFGGGGGAACIYVDTIHYGGKGGTHGGAGGNSGQSGRNGVGSSGGSYSDTAGGGGGGYYGNGGRGAYYGGGGGGYEAAGGNASGRGAGGGGGYGTSGKGGDSEKDGGIAAGGGGGIGSAGGYGGNGICIISYWKEVE